MLFLFCCSCSAGDCRFVVVVGLVVLGVVVGLEWRCCCCVAVVGMHIIDAAVVVIAAGGSVRMSATESPNMSNGDALCCSQAVL